MENKELRETVKTLVAEVEKTHRYSMSRIYGAYNQVFDKNETPQSCASCLIRKVNELKQWLEASEPEQEEEQKAEPENERKKTVIKTKKTKKE